MSADPDNKIDCKTIKLAKSGDEAAISKIVDKFHSYLLFVANNQLDPALAGRASPSDVVQDTVVQLPQKIRDFNGNSELELKAWLRAALCNTVKNTRRYHLQQKRSVAREVKLPSSKFKDDALTPSKELQSRERLSEVENGLKKLSEKDREVLRMRHEEGWTFAEIGKVLSISTDAARMSWGRAIERLKKQIEKTERFDR